MTIMAAVAIHADERGVASPMMRAAMMPVRMMESRSRAALMMMGKKMLTPVTLQMAAMM